MVKAYLSRRYPKYVKGNPQLRIFLPNFWMKLVKPTTSVPPNHVQFIVPLEMSQHDVKNYLEKIYKIPVTQVIIKHMIGEIKKTHKNYLIKDSDYKMAYVTIPDDMKFEYPDLYPEKKKVEERDEQKRLADQAKGAIEQRRKNSDRLDVPSWFGI